MFFFQRVMHDCENKAFNNQLYCVFLYYFVKQKNITIWVTRLIFCTYSDDRASQRKFRTTQNDAKKNPIVIVFVCDAVENDLRVAVSYGQPSTSAVAHV